MVEWEPVRFIESDDDSEMFVTSGPRVYLDRFRRVSHLHLLLLIATSALCAFFWYVSSLAAEFDRYDFVTGRMGPRFSVLSFARLAALTSPIGAWVCIPLGLTRMSVYLCAAPWIGLVVLTGLSLFLR